MTPLATRSVRAAHTGRRGNRLRDARGLVLIEVLLVMAVIGIVLSTATVATHNAFATQRKVHAVDVATHAAHGVLHEASSLPWAQLGFTGDEPGFTEAHAGQPSVTVTDPADLAKLTARDATPAGRILPVEEVTYRGIPVTLNTHIVWQHLPATGGDAAAFGQKKIVVTATWRVGSHHGTATFETLRTPSLAEVVPPTSLGGTP